MRRPRSWPTTSSNWLDSRPIAARRVGAAERAWLWCKRKPAVAAPGGGGRAGGGRRDGADHRRAGQGERRPAPANGKLDTANARPEVVQHRCSTSNEPAPRIARRRPIDAVKKFRDAVANKPVLKNNPALESLRKTLLKEPLAFFRALRNRLQDDGDTTPESLARLAARHAPTWADLTAEIGDNETP